ncbi:MAG: transposase [Anaerolineales bacterium]|nr:transposase [Anaerolineales bacterium]
MSEQTITLLQQFRAGLYHSFRQRADAVFELIDALASDPQARSPVELSLSPVFRRQYASVYDGLDGWPVDQSQLKALLLAVASVPAGDGFRLIGLDHTPKPRPYAETVSDRSFVYQPTLIRGNKPVTMGTPTRSSVRLSRLTGRPG